MLILVGRGQYSDGLEAMYDEVLTFCPKLKLCVDNVYAVLHCVKASRVT